ncbi:MULTISPECIES: DUF1439 domain-containing protein [Microbulbifer]|uniref:DUF1439 domain-containing protein n=1 Tax=Microbulbifer TaxID=48073 RepID=UPI001E2A6DBD|nr:MULTISPECIES: DUF1439 domain-containing protein [Microbulbifer]UHQ55062.1 DUF1439 domain-containing protein [Microbulbifer sp. YPW16]
MTRVLVSLGIALLLLIAAGYIYFSGKEVELRISEAQILETLESNLPLTRTYLVIFDLTLDNPRIALNAETGRVNAGLDITLDIKSREGSKGYRGAADVSGVPSFVAENGEFYLQQIVVENLEIEGMDDKQLARARNAVQVALTEYYRNHPIYRLKDNSARQRLARMALKDINIEGNELVVTLGL